MSCPIILTCSMAWSETCPKPVRILSKPCPIPVQIVPRHCPNPAWRVYWLWNPVSDTQELSKPCLICLSPGAKNLSWAIHGPRPRNLRPGQPQLCDGSTAQATPWCWTFPKFEEQEEEPEAEAPVAVPSDCPMRWFAEAPSGDQVGCRFYYAVWDAGHHRQHAWRGVHWARGELPGSGSWSRCSTNVLAMATKRPC